MKPWSVCITTKAKGRPPVTHTALAYGRTAKEAARQVLRDFDLRSAAIGEVTAWSATPRACTGARSTVAA